MKEGFTTYIDNQILELRTKPQAERMVTNWQETADYVKEEIGKIINTLES